jgi:phosphinothricin acetyltransferase
MIRSATLADAQACLAIYTPAITESATSFELEVPTVAEFAGRIDKALADYAWLVFESDGRVVGYAYGGLHRARPAYRWSTEVSVYVAPDQAGKGIGRRLYEALFPILAGRGYATALAGITLPNDASVALHRALGFTPVGVFHNIGWKFGRWHDTSWWERRWPPAVRACSSSAWKTPTAARWPRPSRTCTAAIA